MLQRFCSSDSARTSLEWATTKKVARWLGGNAFANGDLINRRLKAEREKSDPEGRCAKGLEWRKGGIGRILEPDAMTRLYNAYGVEWLDDETWV
jgi:hypothetical protein